MSGIVLKIITALLAFAIGAAAAAAAEAMLEGTPAGADVPSAGLDGGIDRHRATADAAHAPQALFHVAGIGLGSREVAVRKAFGEPKRVTLAERHDHPLKTFEYDGIEIRLTEWEFGWTVDEITLTSAKWSFQGLELGSPASEVRRVLGVPVAGGDAESYEYMGAEAGEYLIFYLADGQVTGIMTGFLGC
jgi:hypothetical protein